MMKYSIKLIFFISFFSLQQLNALFKETLDEFVERVIKNFDDQEGFRCYYSNFLDKQSRVSDKIKKRKLIKRRTEALSSLEIKDPSTYKKIAKNDQLDLDKQDRDTRLFLIRYRVFEDYQQYQNTQHIDIWNKTKSYLADMGDRVTTFVKDIKNKIV